MQLKTKACGIQKGLGVKTNMKAGIQSFSYGANQPNHDQTMVRDVR